MGWGPVPRRSPSGSVTGWRVVNTTTRRGPGPRGAKAAVFPTKTAALAAVAAINVAYKRKPEVQRRRLEAATAAAATRRRNRARSRRR